MHSIAIDVGLESKVNYDKKVKITIDGSEVFIGFVYLENNISESKSDVSSLF